MKNLIVLIATIASLSVLAGDVKLGDNALNETEQSSNNIAIGNRAGESLSQTTSSTFIGSASGMGASSSDNNIAIGNGAMAYSSNNSGVIAIGNGELARVGGLRDSISMNSQQFFMSRQLNMFALNPLQKKIYTDSPLYYHNEELRINCSLFLNGEELTVMGCDGLSIIGKEDGCFSLSGFYDARSDSVPYKDEDGNLVWQEAQTIEVVTDVRINPDTQKMQKKTATIKFYGTIDSEGDWTDL